MAQSEPLHVDQEARAQELAQRIRQQSDQHILDLARLLVCQEDQTLFGETEFQAREIVHRIANTAYQQRLQKKRLRRLRSRLSPMSANSQVSRPSTSPFTVIKKVAKDAFFKC